MFLIRLIFGEWQIGCETEQVLCYARSLSSLDAGRESLLASSIASWAFSAHACSDDELVHIACLMLQHALNMPELEKWRLPAGKPFATILIRTERNRILMYFCSLSRSQKILVSQPSSL